MRSERRREALAGKYLEANELRTLLDGMKVEKWKLLTEFLVLSGLRIGEVIALQQTDVNLTTLQITVDKTYSLITRGVSPSAKTEAGNRVISIQDELLDCIHRINGIFPKRRKLFFPDLVYEAYAKYLRENTKALVGKKLSPHALRHTSVALFAAAGVDLSVIARRLGHADSRITRDVYMHVTQRLMERDALQLQKVRVL
jgi:integrase